MTDVVNLLAFETLLNMMADNHVGETDQFWLPTWKEIDREIKASECASIECYANDCTVPSLSECHVVESLWRSGHQFPRVHALIVSCVFKYKTVAIEKFVIIKLTLLSARYGNVGAMWRLFNLALEHSFVTDPVDCDFLHSLVTESAVEENQDRVVREILTKIEAPQDESTLLRACSSFIQCNNLVGFEFLINRFKPVVVHMGLIPEDYQSILNNMAVDASRQKRSRFCMILSDSFRWKDGTIISPHTIWRYT